MNPEVECQSCGWVGDASMLVTEDADDIPSDQCVYNHCPECGSTEIEDYEE